MQVRHRTPYEQLVTLICELARFWGCGLLGTAPNGYFYAEGMLLELNGWTRETYVNEGLAAAFGRNNWSSGYPVQPFDYAVVNGPTYRVGQLGGLKLDNDQRGLLVPGNTNVIPMTIDSLPISSQCAGEITLSGVTLGNLKFTVK